MAVHPSTTTWRRVRVALALVLACGVLAQAPAGAVTAAAPVVTLSNAYAGVSGVTYTFSGYTVDNGEMATGAVITFPAGTDVAAATLLSPSGTLSVNGQTVTLTFAPPIQKGNPITIAIGGIRNPVAPGTYNVGTITFNTANPANNNARAPQYHPSADYAVLGHFLTLTLSTPDPAQTVQFGNVSPDVTTLPKVVQLTVDSSTTYTITRTVAGDSATLGLAVTGTASGSGTAGTSSYSDSMTVTAPWTADPDVTYTATVTYTVVQY